MPTINHSFQVNIAVMQLILISLFLADSNLLPAQKESTECDTSVYALTKQMPLYTGDLDQILHEIDQKLDLEIKNDLRNDTTIIGTTITCKGEVKIKYTNDNLSVFYNLLEDGLNKLTWIPAKNDGAAKNFETIIRARIKNFKLDLELPLKKVKGKLINCRAVNENTVPIPYARFKTTYNNCIYIANEHGYVELYAEPKDEVKISHVSFESVSFNIMENKNSYLIVLRQVVFELEPLNLKKYSPKKLPYKHFKCTYQNWQEKEKKSVRLLFMDSYNTRSRSVKITKSLNYLLYGDSSHVFFGYNDFYKPEMSEFNNGYECLYNYMVNKFVLPEKAVENNYSAETIVSFTIDKKGMVKNVEISEPLKYGIDTSLKTLFENMPKWKPATQANEETEQDYVIKVIVDRNRYWKKYYK